MANELLDLIKAKRLEIQTLKQQLRQLEDELDAAKRALLDDGVQVEPTGTAGGNSVVWTVEVMRDKGEPMHVNDALARIQHRFGQTVKYATLVSNLVRLSKEGKTFFRAGKNIYGLIEWRPDAAKAELFDAEEDVTH